MAATGYQMLHHGEHTYTTASASPGPDNGHDAQRSLSAHPGSHRRTYQACIPCRRRKVRCDLGEVDNPHEPPCGRCRRESKECFFSATRRKKKNAADQADLDDGDHSHEIRTTRKRQRVSSSVENDIVVDEVEEDYDETPRTPGGSVGRAQPLRRPAAPKLVQYKEEEMKASEETAALLQRNELHGGHDALKLLYVAANHMRDTIHARTPSHGAGSRPNLKGAAPTSHAPVPSPDMETMPPNSFTQGPMQMFHSDGVWKTKLGADGTQGSISDSMNFDPADYAGAHRAWSRFRFVRAGWFTAKEGIDYILYFYKYLSPLTPVILPKFTQLSSHKKLLEEEPMLAVTMLVIASRHMRLPGPGAHSRPYALHDKFYRYLDGMIKRVIWGQEQFGGGFCGAGAQPGCDINPLTRKGLRTLGTVESLLLLTEWHPRAMHFPPDDDDEELMVPDEPITSSHIDNNGVPRGAGGHRMDAWLEPIWRSDRMCWMLTGMAMSLAFEIGVFDKSEWKRHTNSLDQQPLSPEELAAYDLRRTNVRDVLLIFVTLTSGRVGLTSMLPSNYSKPQDSELCNPGATGPHSSTHQVTLHYWLRMAAIMRDGNQQIFANKEFTRQLIRDNKYRPVLERLRGPLELWRQEFDSCSAIPQYMRYILKIEFEYARVYLYAIALQAVVERCVNELTAGSSGSLAEAAAATGGATDLGNIAITPGLLARKLGEDRPYALAVGDAARNLLRIVVDGLAPKEYLRHAPVRTYFRIISTAIVLLKTFALGASESDVAESLTLMDRTIDALRNCIVDDVHVACRFADLLQSLTQNLKPRLVRMAADGRGGRSRRASRQATQPQTPDEEHNLQKTPLGPPAQATTGASNQHQQQWYGNGNGNAIFAQHGTASSRPMYGLPDEIYDLTGSDNQYTVMPPPGFSSTSPASANPNDPMVSGVDNGGYDPLAAGDFGQDYYTLDLNPILSMPNGDIDNSMFGVQVNGRDLLEVLWDQPQDGQQFQPPMNSMGYPGGTNGLFNGTNGYH